jgi:antitoxin PrlF
MAVPARHASAGRVRERRLRGRTSDMAEWRTGHPWAGSTERFAGAAWDGRAFSSGQSLTDVPLFDGSVSSGNPSDMRFSRACRDEPHPRHAGACWCASPTFRLYDSRMPRTTLRAKGQLTLPEAIRAAARLEEGDLLDAEITEEGILLRPQKVIDATQAWFWNPEWQAGERDADADLAAGRVEAFDSGEDFLDALSARAKPAARRRKR